MVGGSERTSFELQDASEVSGLCEHSPVTPHQIAQSPLKISDGMTKE